MGALRRLIKPLQSRKVRVALATVVAAYAAEFGLGVSESLVMVVMAVRAASDAAGPVEAMFGPPLASAGARGW